MVPGSVPEWYTRSHESLARRGLRVLALGYKKVSLQQTPNPLDKPRAWVESQLHFGGFIAFECKIRADSAVVMQSLIQSDHKVAMITGDALLTSLHVAKKVCICNEQLPCLTLTVVGGASKEQAQNEEGEKEEEEKVVDKNNKKKGDSAPVEHCWVQFDEATGKETRLPFDVSNNAVTALGAKYNLLTTEEAFLSATAATGGKTSLLWGQAGRLSFRFFMLYYVFRLLYYL
jgi:hypothetical protein